jgi:hypothetical protein
MIGGIACYPYWKRLLYLYIWISFSFAIRLVIVSNNSDLALAPLLPNHIIFYFMLLSAGKAFRSLS